MSPLQCHMQRMHYQPTGQPKVDWKASLTHCQSSVNCLVQNWVGWSAQTLWMKGFRLVIHACSTKVKLMKNEEPTPNWGTRILQHGKMTSLPVPLICGLACAFSTPCVMPVHSFHGEYSVKTLCLNHHRSARHKWFLALWANHQCWLCGGILDGGSWPKDIWSECSCPTGKTLGQLPIKTSWVSGQCNTKSNVHGEIMR